MTIKPYDPKHDRSAAEAAILEASVCMDAARRFLSDGRTACAVDELDCVINAAQCAQEVAVWIRANVAGERPSPKVIAAYDSAMECIAEYGMEPELTLGVRKAMEVAKIVQARRAAKAAKGNTKCSH